MVPAATGTEASEATEEEGEEEEEDAQKVEAGGESGEEGGRGRGAGRGAGRRAGCWLGGRGTRALGAALCPAASVGGAGVGSFFPFPFLSVVT